VTLIYSLKSLQPSIKNLPLDIIIKDIENGKQFHEALNKHPMFNEMFCKIIRIGELGGHLESVCKNISDYLYKQQIFKNKVKQALILPVITLILAMMLIFVIFIFVIPHFEFILISLGKPLPRITQFIFLISRYFVSLNLFFFMGFGLFILLYKIIIRKLKYRELRDQFVLVIPVVGNVTHLYDLIMFTRYLSILLSCGMPLLVSISYSKDIIKNLFFRNKISLLIEDIRNGVSMFSAMEKESCFPYKLITLVSVGEGSGNLARMLDKAGLVFEVDLNKVLDVITNMVQPAMIIFLGLVIMLMIISIYIPIFGISSSL